MKLEKIISGGQTGADRAALDWAIAHGIPHGGWCPPGRLAEDGVIPSRYLLNEMTHGSYRQRTRQNVADSDGTLILNMGELDGGTLETLRFAEKLAKPFLIASLDADDLLAYLPRIETWLRSNGIRVLNVAGPRESRRPGIHAATWSFLRPLWHQWLNPNRLSVTFDDCDAGWITLWLSAGLRTMRISMSHLWDPLPDMLAWLEAIAVGVEKCGFAVNMEGSFMHFSATRTYVVGDWHSTLHVSPSYMAETFELRISTRELVKKVYEAFRGFAESGVYVPREWEQVTLERGIRERLNMDPNDWVESMLGKTRRELQMAIWLADQETTRGNSSHDQTIGTSEELLELTGKAVCEHGWLPYYWELKGWDEITSEQERRTFLQECLEEYVNPMWHGYPWPKMRSKMIEAWLADESAKPSHKWEKWLIE